MPRGKPHIVSTLFEPLSDSHLPISLSAKVYARAFEPRGVSDPREDHLASNARIDPLLHQVAGAHLDVEGDLVIDLLIERYTPQP
ncbi:MAG TPA: hypothetical protein VMS40_02110, partial [Vicinamibacterales bacterium]|nr:hypothetical protein [Vicinamibacterales bacterium]